MASKYTINWQFEYKEEDLDLNKGITELRREVKPSHIQGTHKKDKLPEDQFYRVILTDNSDQYISEIYCTKLEGHEALQSLDIYAFDNDIKHSRPICYVKVVENNTFKALEGENPDH